jgi:hypothetical protein
MPATPYAKVLVSVNGDPNVSGGLDVPSGAELTLTPESIVGWQRAVWEFYDYPEGWTAPPGWTLRADGIISCAGYAPPPITLPANTSLWGVWMLRLRVNEQATDDKNRIGDLLDDSTCLSMLSPRGQRDIGARERSHFTTTLTRIKGWLRSYQRNLRTIEAQLSAGGAAPGGVGGDLQWNNGLGGFTEAPVVGYIKTKQVAAIGDPYCRVVSVINHLTTTDNTTHQVILPGDWGDGSGLRVDVVLTAICDFELASWTLSGLVRDGDIRGNTTDPNPDIDPGLVLAAAELTLTTGLTLNLTGLAGKRITWGWEVRIQRIEPEPA